MFELYAELRGVTVSEAKLELAAILCGGEDLLGTTSAIPAVEAEKRSRAVELSTRASPEEIDHTMREMMNLLPLTAAHREHLNKVRGLSDDEIRILGLKSTPSYKLRHALPSKLLSMGCRVAGVPGFYMDKYGKWTANFTSWTAGILIPVHSVDGLFCGAQIRLDNPIRDNPDDLEDEGTKYIWFSTSGKYLGASSGSPVNLVGDSRAHTVYVTEGALKAGITHCLTNRSVLSIQGANNLGGLKDAFQYLHERGTELIVEALDTDKFSNANVAKGAQKIYLLARQCGMRCQSLTWNPNYKGIDDWQIALRRRAQKGKGDQAMNFKQAFLTGRCEITHLRECARAWEAGAKHTASLQGALGLDEQEFAAYQQQGEGALEALLIPQRKTQRFRIYQLDLSAGQIIPFAFRGIKALLEAKYQQPPATAYRMVCDDALTVPTSQEAEKTLQQIAEVYSDPFPNGYEGRSVAPSDVIELYNEEQRQYFYCDRAGVFSPVQFSPALVKNRVKDK